MYITIILYQNLAHWIVSNSKTYVTLIIFLFAIILVTGYLRYTKILIVFKVYASEWIFKIFVLISTSLLTKSECFLSQRIKNENILKLCNKFLSWMSVKYIRP